MGSKPLASLCREGWKCWLEVHGHSRLSPYLPGPSAYALAAATSGAALAGIYRQHVVLSWWSHNLDVMCEQWWHLRVPGDRGGGDG